MTNQEELFFDRVALKMAANKSLSILEASKAVCDDDTRILNTYSRMSDAAQSEFKRMFVSVVYNKLRVA